MENLINSLVSKAVGVTDQQIQQFLATSPNDAQIAKAMETYGVSPAQMAQVTGIPEGQVAARVAATLPPNEARLLGDTYVQAVNQVSGSGENQQIGGLENVITYKANENKVGGGYQQYNPDGTLQRTGTQQEVNATKDFLKFAALTAGGLYGLNALGATEAGLAAAGGGGSTLGSLSSLGTPTVAGMGAGTGLTAGAAGLGLNAGTAGLGAAGTGAGLTGTLGATNAALGGAALGSTLGGLATGVGAGALGSTLGSLATGAGAAGAGSALGSTLGAGAGSALGTSLATGLGLSALGNIAGTVANQGGINDARSLINQYGGIANTQLGTAYQNAQNLNTANRTDLGNIYGNTAGNMQNLYNQQVGYQQPYQDIGRAGSTGLLNNQDYLTRQFTNADLNANLAPNYAFQLAQGQMANQRAANMGGGALSGNALQGLQRYTQDYAGGAYQNAFTNFQNQRQNIYNNLSNMANIGTTSAGQLANLGANYGSNMGSLASNYGGNLTTSYGQGIGAANAYGLNTANLATGLGSALAGNAVAGGANTANALNTLGNTALLGSMIKAT
jgi:hypothetical protein